MKSIPAYFDGNAVRTLDDYPFEKNQRLIITVLDDKEQDIWQTAAKEKKDTSFIFAMQGILSHDDVEDMRKNRHLKFKEM